MPSASALWRLQRPFGAILSQKRFRACTTLQDHSRHLKCASTSATVLNIPRANVYRFGDANRATPVFRDLDWSIKANESWAVVGSGSGEKSSIFDVDAHGTPPDTPTSPRLPRVCSPFLSDANEARDPHNSVSIVSFANKRTAGGAFYDYTARYGAVREEDRITLRESMFPETINDLKSQTRISLEPASTDYKLFDYLVEKMGLENLLDLPRIALSNGQTRRARILKALLGKPRLLLLDEPLTGLDVDNRSTVLAILHELHAACDPHIIIGLRMQDAIPDWITHLAIVNDGQVKTGSKDQMLQYKAQIQKATSAREDAVANVKPVQTVGEPVVEMKNVSVTYGPRQASDTTSKARTAPEKPLSSPSSPAITRNPIPSSHTAPVHNCGTSASSALRAPRLATPLLQSRIGIVTPELFDAFPRRAPGMSVWEALGTGFDGGFVPKGKDGVGIGVKGVLSDEEREWRVRRCWEVLEALGPTAWRSPSATSMSPSASAPMPASALPGSANISPTLTTFASLSFPDLPLASQRIVLLMRALVARPPLVLLDEVWSGMDAGMVAAAHAYLRTGGGVTSEQAVVVVSHVEGGGAVGRGGWSEGG
ncbi:p-loop containing nucleoside triphosphate hydrolase protein [Mycena venus]|uniref:p-loop containing nucleoside triphosphate hydrolase protein n=1 Tax=Mycena venus TaxID=2733690 RepID=A0A8H7D7V7_9AGAR|nr:p-loop containing nucleoside triphosphate hydrolase protein [Mycena venus]